MGFCQQIDYVGSKKVQQYLSRAGAQAQADCWVYQNNANGQ